MYSTRATNLFENSGYLVVKPVEISRLPKSPALATQPSPVIKTQLQSLISVFRPPNTDFIERLAKIRSERVSVDPQP